MQNLLHIFETLNKINETNENFNEIYTYDTKDYKGKIFINNSLTTNEENEFNTLLKKASVNSQKTFILTFIEWTLKLNSDHIVHGDNVKHLGNRKKANDNEEVNDGEQVYSNRYKTIILTNLITNFINFIANNIEPVFEIELTFGSLKEPKSNYSFTLSIKHTVSGHKWEMFLDNNFLNLENSFNLVLSLLDKIPVTNLISLDNLNLQPANIELLKNFNKLTFPAWFDNDGHNKIAKALHNYEEIE